MTPGVTGLAVLGLGVSLGFNSGYPLNPARDLAPRLFMGKNYALKKNRFLDIL